MSAAVVDVAGTVPEPSEMSVSEAYESLKELLDPEQTYLIEWAELPQANPIISRFARKLAAEAWLTARPVDSEGKPTGSTAAVATVLIPFSRVVDYDTVEQSLRSQLSALTEDTDA